MRAIRAGATYANVHTSKFPGGEIRSQIRTDNSGPGGGKGGKGGGDHHH